MRTFDSKPKTVQKTSSARKAPFPANSGNRGVNSILRLQRTVGNQAVQRMLEERTDDGGQPSLAEHGRESPESGRQSRPVAHAAVDGRGGGVGGEEVEDRRVESTVQLAGKSRPTPLNVRNGPKHAPIKSGNRVGMSIAITITSSSGKDADMAGIQDSEKVGLSYNHTGSMKGVAALASSQSGFMAGYPIPDDQHAWSKSTIIDLADNKGGDGSFEKQQLDVYKDPKAGVTSPKVIPKSGYIIKREIVKKGKSITFRTSKRAGAAKVGGFSTVAGPSATQSEDVKIR
jgi:hypothetical protein